MRPVYISGAACISVQPTLEPDFFENLKSDLSQNIIYAQQPSYKEFIPPAQIRRMSKVVKMSTVTSKKAMEEAGMEMPDAIIVGTGMGCTEDSEKFLRNVIQNNEDHLTPTNFIQSTHNTVAGQIALGLGCHAYNFTYVNSGSSLEFSLLDAKLQIENEEAHNVLVGAADETAHRTSELYQLAGIVKKQEEFPVDLLKCETSGVFWGEGSAFFALNDKISAETYAQLQGVTMANHLKVDETEAFIVDFLAKNDLKPADIDVLMLGFDGEGTSKKYYEKAQETFTETCQTYYKHLSGEYNTASGFGFFLANHILKKQQIPEIVKISGNCDDNIRNVLIYNNYFGNEHSLILLKKV